MNQYIRYYLRFGDDSRMWEIFDNQTNVVIAWYEYPYAAEEHAADLNAVDNFEYAIAAYNADTY